MQRRYLWHFGSFLLLIILALIGLYCFTRGFLLKRVELPFKSCSDESEGESWCSADYQPRFRRAVILIVDALKYEFLLYHTKSRPDDTRTFQNKVPVVNQLIKHHPENAALFRFIADPPTTTMQRIKGLTTGSLPTFIDVSLNFAASSVGEDNIIDQARRMGKNITFLGDDTWLNLYPTGFTKSVPFPSFDVKDLDTVDYGVWQHLVPEIRNGQADLLIAHILGVDHCGHRYGRDHPEMARKLTELNGYIKAAIRELANDTVLFVMGDHGMTKSGDHGGDSADEVEAALFVYSPQPFVDTTQFSETVAQVDFVPTLSLLLGHPIPFSNLGRIIPSLFPVAPQRSGGKSLLTQQDALKRNADQVISFIRNYSHTSPDFSPSVLSSLEQQYRDALATGNASMSMEFLDSTLSSCRAVWAKFDERNIWFGILFVGAAGLGLTVILLATVGLFWVRDYYALIALAVGIFHLLSMVSNSFQVWEDFSVACVLQAFIWINFLGTYQKGRSSRWQLLRFICLTVLLRSLEYVRRCREEQTDCAVSPLAVAADSIVVNSDVYFVRLVLGLSATTALFLWTMRKVWSEAHRKGFWNEAFSFFAVSNGCAVMAKSLAGEGPEMRGFLFPRIAMGCGMFTMVHLWVSPVFIADRTPGLSNTKSRQNGYIPNGTLKTDTADDLLTVSSFFRVYSMFLVLPILLFTNLLLGDVWGFQIIFLVSLMHLHIADCRPSSQLTIVVMWSLLSWHIFFATGHQTTFPTLHWDAAFIGVRAAAVSPVLPAVLMSLETFAGHAVLAMALPSLLKSDPNDSVWLENPVEFYLAVWRLFMGYLLFHIGKLFIVMLNAAVNRRHLMVWKIFAPRFIFEGAAFLITCLFLVIAYLYTLRASNAAIKFVLEKDVPLESYHAKRRKSDSEKGSRKRR